MKDDSKLEEIKDSKTKSNNSEPKIPIPKQIKANNNSVIILRHRGLSDNITDLEEKYSAKFGCKVVILESNIDYVDTING